MIFVFNPETELALAHGAVSYTPPGRIADITRKLALLPVLYAPEGSGVLLRHAQKPEGIAVDIASRRGIRIIGMNDLRGSDEQIIPWGWNHALRAGLLRAGIAPSALAAEADIDCIRKLAHRSSAGTINALLGHESATGCRSVAEALDALARFGRGVFKAPWSSSGRGIWMSDKLTRGACVRIIGNVIRTQGEVFVERYVDKRMDCATEWYCRRGMAEFRGFSVFASAPGGARYVGNEVAPQEELRARCPEVDDGIIMAQRRALEQFVAQRYEGPVGIDMMIAADGRVIPCVEMNVRFTMGHVALSVWDILREKMFFSPWERPDSIGL